MKVKFLTLAGAAVAMTAASVVPADAGCRSHSRSCYVKAKAAHHARHATHRSRRVLVQPRSSHIVRTPAVYRRSMKRVLVSPARTIVHTEPAAYRDTVKRVHVKLPAHNCGHHAGAHSYKDSHARGHASHSRRSARHSRRHAQHCGGGYVTKWVKTKELVRGPSKWTERVRAQYKYVVVNHLVRPAKVHTVHKPAVYARRHVSHKAHPAPVYSRARRSYRSSISQRWAKRRAAYKARRAARHAHYAKRRAAYKARRAARHAHYAKRRAAYRAARVRSHRVRVARAH